MPSENEISDAVHDILRTNDLQKITLRMVMNMLCDKFSLPKEHLNQQKPFVRNKINEFLANSYAPDPNEQVEPTKQDEDDEDEDDEEGEEEEDNSNKKRKRNTPQPKKKAARPRSSANTGNKPVKLTGLERAVVLAEPLSEFFGEKVIARSQISKRISTYAKENKLQDPSDGRRINCDEQLKKALNVDNFTYFSLTKIVSGLVTKPEDCDEEIQEIARQCESKLLEEKTKKLQDLQELNNSNDSSNTANTNGTKRPRKKQKNTSNDENKPKKPSALLRPMQLSDALIAVVGETQLPRSEVLKKLWNYIRENNLKDPNNARQVICDDKLKAVFDGNNFVGNMAILKHISAHMTKIDNVPN